MQEEAKASNETTKHTVDLIEGSYFFAMRGGEIAKTRTPLLTTRIRLKDVTFRDRNRLILPHDHPNLHREATRVTIRFQTQKNGEKDEKRSQKKTNLQLCPVVVWVRIVRTVRRRVWNFTPDTPVCSTITTRTGTRMEITLEAMVDAMRKFCVKLSLKKSYGFEPHELGARSIRTGAAMALFMRHKDPTTTKILGRWKSDAFMEYIRPQVLEMTDDLATAMVFLEPMTDLSDTVRRTTPEASRNGEPFRLFTFY